MKPVFGAYCKMLASACTCSVAGCDTAEPCVGAGSVQSMETDVTVSVPSRAAATTATHSSDRSSGSHGAAGQHVASGGGSSSYSAGNPYMSKHMYSSSFMSTEGSQSIQSLIGTQTREELGRSAPSSSHAYPLVSVHLPSYMPDFVY